MQLEASIILEGKVGVTVGSHYVKKKKERKKKDDYYFILFFLKERKRVSK